MTTPRLTLLRNKPRFHQRGAGVLMLMLIVMLGLITLFSFRMDRKGPELNADRQTALALGQAKEALLGDSASNNDPGVLSCPSIDGTQGTAKTTAAGVIKCGTATNKSNLGWLPWKTLGLGEIRDGSASHLWYMLSDAYVDKGTYSPPPTAATLNLTIVVVDVNPTNLTETILSSSPIPNVAAVIIAPGPPLPTQNRSGVALTNSSYWAEYLEVAADSGANTLTIKVERKQSGHPVKYNDQYLLITVKEVLERSTPTVAASFAAQLSAYYKKNQSYPKTGWLPGGTDWSGSGTYADWAKLDQITQLIPTNYQKTNSTSGIIQFNSCAATYSVVQSAASGAQVSRVGHC